MGSSQAGVEVGAQREGARRRAMIVTLPLVLLTLILVLSPITWRSLDWGSIPQWIGAAALVAVAIGVWRLGSTSVRQER